MRIFLILLSICCIYKVKAQSPFKLNTQKEAILMSIGILGSTGAYLLKNQINPLSTEQINNLNSNNILWFDRSATGFNSLQAKQISKIAQYSSPLLAASFLSKKSPSTDYFCLAIMAFEVFSINTALNLNSKVIFKRIRPYAYNPDISIAKKQTTDAKLSFYSGSSSTTASISFYIATVVQAYNFNQYFKTFIWASAIGLSGTVAYTRVKAGEHFVSDVLAASLIGAGIGIIVPKMHQNIDHKKRSKLTSTPFIYNNAYGLSLMYQIN